MKVTRSLLRGFEVLEALANHGQPLGPAKLGEIVGLDKATVARLLGTLSHAGYVAHDTTSGRYWLTGRVLRLSRAFLEHSDLRGLARPHLTRLRDDTGETVHLGQLDGRRIVYIDKLETASSVRLVSAVGQTMPLHTTALGKAMLAALGADHRAALLAGLELPIRTERSITDPAALHAELRATHDRGFAVDRGENEDNVSCVAAPLHDSDGHLVGAISVSGPAFRMDPRLDELGERCRGAAETIARHLPAGEVPPVLVNVDADTDTAAQAHTTTAARPRGGEGTR